MVVERAPHVNFGRRLRPSLLAMVSARPGCLRSEKKIVAARENLRDSTRARAQIGPPISRTCGEGSGANWQAGEGSDLSHGKRIAKNTLSQSVAFVAKAFSTLGLYFVIARLPDGQPVLGQYAVLMTFSALAAGLSMFGLSDLVAREVACRREDTAYRRDLIDHGLGLTVVLSVLTGGLMLAIGIAWLDMESVALVVLLTGAALGLESLVLLVLAVFRGFEEMRRSSRVLVVMELTFLAFGMVAAILHASIVALMVAFLLSRVVGFSYAVIEYRRRFGALCPRYDAGRWRYLLRAGLPFAANFLLSPVYVRIDKILLTFFVPFSLIGAYEAASILIMRLNVVARTVNASLMPFLAAQHTKGSQSRNRYAARSIRALLVAGGFFAAVFHLYSEEILTCLYGDSFLWAAPALQTLALVIPLRMLSHSLAIVLTATGRQGQRSMATLLAASGNLTFGLALIPSQGIDGAALATLLTEILLLTTLICILRKELSALLDRDVLLAPACGILGLVVVDGLLHVPGVWLAALLASVPVYLAITLVLDPSLGQLLRRVLARRTRAEG